MATKIEVKKDGTTAIDVHEVDGEPEVVSHLINSAIKKEHKLVTLKIPGDKKLSVIADNVYGDLAGVDKRSSGARSPSM